MTMTGQLRDSSRRLQLCLPLYAAWIVSYELVGRYASHLDAVDLSLAIDAMIPFQSAWVWVYGLTYVVPLAAIIMIREDATLIRGLIAVTFASCLGYVVFIVFPVATPQAVLGETVSDNALALLRRLDVPANQLPSLHVANAWILFRTVTSEPRSVAVRWIAAAVACAIAVSTLFVKQHVFLDAVAGFVTGAFSFYAAQKLMEVWRWLGTGKQAV